MVMPADMRFLAPVFSSLENVSFQMAMEERKKPLCGRAKRELDGGLSEWGAEKMIKGGYKVTSACIALLFVTLRWP